MKFTMKEYDIILEALVEKHERLIDEYISKCTTDDALAKLEKWSEVDNIIDKIRGYKFWYKMV